MTRSKWTRLCVKCNEEFEAHKGIPENWCTSCIQLNRRIGTTRGAAGHYWEHKRLVFEREERWKGRV